MYTTNITVVLYSSDCSEITDREQHEERDGNDAERDMYRSHRNVENRRESDVW